MVDAPKSGADDALFLCREDLHEYLGFVRLHAEAAQLHIDAADDVGMRYSMQRMIAYVKAAAATGNDIARIRNEADEKRPPSDTGAAAA